MEILSEDGKSERIVWFSEDEWQVLAYALDFVYNNDGEIKLGNRYGPSARDLFMGIRRDSRVSVDGYTKNHEYLERRRDEDWKSVTED